MAEEELDLWEIRAFSERSEGQAGHAGHAGHAYICHVLSAVQSARMIYRFVKWESLIDFTMSVGKYSPASARGTLPFPAKVKRLKRSIPKQSDQMEVA